VQRNSFDRSIQRRQCTRPDRLSQLLVALVAIIALLIVLLPGLNAPYALHIAVYIPQPVFQFTIVVTTALRTPVSQNEVARPDSPDSVAPLFQRPPPASV